MSAALAAPNPRAIIEEGVGEFPGKGLGNKDPIQGIMRSTAG